MEQKGFLATLFDFSFSEFVTIKIIKLLYGLAMFFAAIGALAAIISGFGSGALTGVITLIVSPLIFLLYVILARVWLEIVIVIFRIAENTKEIADQGHKEADAPPSVQ